MKGNDVLSFEECTTSLLDLKIQGVEALIYNLGRELYTIGGRKCICLTFYKNCQTLLSISSICCHVCRRK